MFLIHSVCGRPTCRLKHVKELNIQTFCLCKCCVVTVIDFICPYIRHTMGHHTQKITTTEMSHVL